MPPPGLESWFRSGPFPPGGGEPRRDDYLWDPSLSEIGIKKRGGRDGVEIKGLVARGTTLQQPFAATIEIWSKWSTAAVSLDGRPCLSVTKTRSIRKFDTAGAGVREVALGSDEQPLAGVKPPELGCLIELVAIQLGDAREAWWSFAFEAFGPLESVEDSLTRTAERVASPAPPALDRGLQLGYPAWLARTARSYESSAESS